MKAEKTGRKLVPVRVPFDGNVHCASCHLRVVGGAKKDEQTGKIYHDTANCLREKKPISLVPPPELIAHSVEELNTSRRHGVEKYAPARPLELVTA